MKSATTSNHRRELLSAESESLATTCSESSFEFPQSYPAQPPVAKFVPPVPHVNVFPSGTVCLSILHDNEGWKPSIDLRQILVGIQGLLDSPNPESPAHEQNYLNYMQRRAVYDENIRRHAKAFTNPTLPDPK